MITDEFYTDKYEQYAELFDPFKTDRQARRKRRPEARHVPKKSDDQVLTEIADADPLEGGFKTTYQPARYEQGWLLASLQTFYEQALISDVLTRVKGGKEATVYSCATGSAVGQALLAVKVYRPQQFRNLRNDKMYREGREVLTASGRPVKTTDHRIMRAIGKKTAFGEQVTHTSWLMHEYTTLERLYRAGAAVPPPIAASDNAILMGYVGDARQAAPTLHEVTLRPEQTEPLFNEVLRNIELMLQHDMIHGDLSAYNILYWQGQITLIDFPQVTNCHTNSRAQFILRRDIQRVCEYFALQGLRRNPAFIADTLWRRYVTSQTNGRAASSVNLIPEVTLS